MSLVEIQDADGVRLVTWNRPDALNALNDEVWDATTDALVTARADGEIRCVVLTGTGRAFTAGQDLTEMLASHDDAAEPHQFPSMLEVVAAFPKPLVAAVNGLGVGIGMTILARHNHPL